MCVLKGIIGMEKESVNQDCNNEQKTNVLVVKGI